MILFFAGMLTVYVVIGLAMWVWCRADVMTHLRAEAAWRKRDINLVYLEFVVLMTCLGWPYALIETDRKVNE